MDVDISDILASVSAPALPQRARDLQALTRAWVNERTAPELLPYPTALVDRVTQRVKSQIETIEDLTGTMDPAANFTLVVLQTELERFRFLLRSFLRARMAKIDRTPGHYRELVETRPDEAVLSDTEQEYLARHAALLADHYGASFLNAFPPQLKRLDDTSGGISMIDRPDEDTAVFCRVMRDVAAPVIVQGEQGASEAELARGDTWVFRWKDVRDACVRGDVELI